MKKLFVKKEVALLAKEKLFDEECFCSYWLVGTYQKLCEFQYYELNRRNSTMFENAFSNKGVTAPIFQQVVDWLEEKHNIHVSRIWYNDGVTPTRWVYHIDGDYTGSDFNEALIQALNRIK